MHSSKDFEVKIIYILFLLSEGCIAESTDQLAMSLQLILVDNHLFTDDHTYISIISCEACAKVYIFIAEDMQSILKEKS